MEESQAGATTEYEGQVYYFCSDICRDEFEANPQRFAVETGALPAV